MEGLFKELGFKPAQITLYKQYPSLFNDEGFCEAWAGYLEMRKLIKKPPTLYAEKLGIGKVLDYSGGNMLRARKIVEQSIENSYQGIFPLRAEEVVNEAPQRMSKKIGG